MGFNPSKLDYEDLPPLYLALLSGEISEAEGLIKQGHLLDDIIEEDGNTFLHTAAREGHIEMVDFFLRNICPISLESFDHVQHTPLMWAAAEGRTKIVRKLLNAGVNPDAFDEDGDGSTAILEAAYYGHPQAVKLLLEAGADPKIKGLMGGDAIAYAWHKTDGDYEKVRRLLPPSL